MADTETLHLDRDDDSARVRSVCTSYDLGDVMAARQRQKGKVDRRQAKITLPLGLRWPAEWTNAWQANFGQLRRNTDRTVAQRLAELTPAAIDSLTARLID